MIKVLSFLSNKNFFVGHCRRPCGPRFKYHCCTPSKLWMTCFCSKWIPLGKILRTI